MNSNIPQRRTSDVLTGGVSVALGLAGVFLPFPISKVISDALPSGLSTVLYAGLLLAGIAVLYGISSKRIEGPGYMIAGLCITTGYFLAYGVAAIAQAWPLTLVAATPYIALSIANLFRIHEISRGSREARAAITRGP